MEIRAKSKKSSLRRKFFLPSALILFFLVAVGISKLEQLNLSFDFDFFGRKEMVKPVPVSSPEAFLKETFNKYGLAAKDLRMTGDEAIASISGIPVYFGLKEDLEVQVVSLQFILRRAKIEGKLPKVVDLRFEKPVVSY